MSPLKKSTPAEKSRDKERAKAALLQGALEEFSAKGFVGASIRDIAARTGLSHGMIRYHYDSKENLWYAAVKYLFDRLHTSFAFNEEQRRLLLEGDKETFRLWLRQSVRYWAKHPEHARLMIQESVTPSPRLSKVVKDHIKPDHVYGAQFIKALQTKGVLPADANPISLMYMMVGASQLMFALAPEAKASYNYNALSKKAIEAHADTVVAIFCP